MAQGKRKWLFHLIMLGFTLIVFEGGSCVALNRVPQLKELAINKGDFLKKQQATIQRTLDGTSPTLVVFDGELGWTHAPNTSQPGFHISASASRGQRSYSATPEQGTLRLATFGDSFTYGAEVEDGLDWAALLEQGGQQVEVMNYGVSGYGPDQAYLRFQRRAPASNAHVATFGLSVWDLPRMMTSVLPFCNPAADFAVKPRFRYVGPQELELVPSPISSMAQFQKYLDDPQAIIDLGKTHDHFYEPAIFDNPLYGLSQTIRLASVSWVLIKRRLLDPDRELAGGRNAGVFNTEGAPYKITLELSRRFSAEAKALGVAPVIILFPDLVDIQRLRSGQPRMAAEWMMACSAMGLDCRDGMGAFEGYQGDPEALFMPHGHYSEAGGRLIAEWFASWLGEFRPLAAAQP